MRTAFTRKRDHRCNACYMHHSDCICSLSPRLNIKTGVHTVMHISEIFKTTATARLIPLAIPRSTIEFRGTREGFYHPFLDLMKGKDQFEGENYNHLFTLFPSDEARLLTPEMLEEHPGSKALLIPDGNWNQASRMIRRMSVFQDTIQIRLPENLQDGYSFRKQSHKDRLSTFEALIYALELIEGSHISDPLKDFFEIMHSRYRRTISGLL